jgi:hypothetical protein
VKAGTCAADAGTSGKAELAPAMPQARRPAPGRQEQATAARLMSSPAHAAAKPRQWRTTPPGQQNRFRTGIGTCKSHKPGTHARRGHPPFGGRVLELQRPMRKRLAVIPRGARTGNSEVGPVQRGEFPALSERGVGRGGGSVSGAGQSMYSGFESMAVRSAPASMALGLASEPGVMVTVRNWPSRSMTRRMACPGS